MSALAQTSPDPASVLAKAVLNAADQLGLKQAELAAVLGIHRTAVSRLKQNPALDPKSKQGELALLVIRIARALFALTGGDKDWIKHFMHNPNKVISKTELTEHIYDQDFDLDSNVIEVFVLRLRKKLDPDGELKPIETLRGRGYRFTMVVS